MCGRFTLRTPASELAQMFALLDVAELIPRYNIAPTQPVLTVRHHEQNRILSSARWGLVPFWAKDLKIGARMINARSETIATKPAFRAAFKKRRCLIPADGFYEWERLSSKKKQPWLMEMQNGQPFAFAGLWETWRPNKDDDSETIESCTIITTTANSVLADLHERMPVILAESDYDLWLDIKTPTDDLQQLLRPCADEEIARRAVNSIVNNARNEVPECTSDPDKTLF